jgi:transcriptional repressor NrdR
VSGTMRCPKCASLETKVLDTRTGKNENSIRRRRECLSCGYRFTTVEEVLRADLQVVKRDGRREEFDRNKMLAGLRKAVEKRPIDVMQIEMMVADVLAALEREYDQEIPSQAIGEQIMLRLRHLDQIAYVRYASVYKDFRDIGELAQEINELRAATEDGQG